MPLVGMVIFFYLEEVKGSNGRGSGNGSSQYEVTGLPD
jgi:hypothetical protein